MRNFRTYLAGLGSGGALVAAAVAAFVAVGAIVGFNGLPISSADDDSTMVVVQSNAPEIAAAASIAPGAAPAADAAPGAAAAVAAATAPASAPVTGPGGAPSGGTELPGDRPGVPGGDPTDDPPGLPDPPPPPDTGTNDVGAVVDEVDETVEDVTGIDTDLGGATEGITDIVDGAVGDLTGGRGLGLDAVEVPDLVP